MTKKILILAMVLCLACAYNAQARLETFDTDLGHFNLEVGNRSSGQNWGFSSTNYAGGTAGELGGTFQRTDTFPHVADGTIGEFPRESTLVLKGRAVMQDINWDGGVNIGYFKQGDKSIQIGLSLSEPKGAGPRIFIEVKGSSALATNVSWGQPFTFDLTYTNGTLSGTVNGVSCSISGNPGTVDAFGVAVGSLSPSSQKVKVYFDNLEYTGGPQIRFADPSFSDSETVSPALIDVLLKNPMPGQTYTVDYAATGGTATNGEDYILEPGTLTFNPGETSKTISMPIVNDVMDEADETVVISLSNPTGPEAMLGFPSTFTYTIIDPGSVVQFAADLGDGPAQAGWVVMPTCGEYYNVDGSGIDVTLETGDPGPCEPRNPDWGLTGSGPLADVEKDLLFADNRAGPDADFIITLVGLAPGIRYMVESYHTRTGNQEAVPIAGVTVTGASDVVTPGPIAQTRDTMDNPAQTQFTAIGIPVTVRYVAAWNGMVQVNGFVLRSVDSPPQVQFASSASSGLETESPANLPVVVLSPPQPNVVTVDYDVTGGTATGGGVDYTLTPGTLTFNPGDTVKTISMGIVDDGLDDEDETVIVSLSNPTGGVSLGTGTDCTYTILDPRPFVGFAAESSKESETVSPASLTVTLSEAWRQTVTVDYTVTGGTATGGGVDYTLDSGTLTFDPCETSRTISVVVVNDDLPEVDETVQVTLSNAVHARDGITSHTFKIEDDDITPSVLADLGNGPVQAGWVGMPTCGEYNNVDGSGIDVTLATGDPLVCESRDPSWGLTGSGPLADVETDLLFADNRAGADADFIITFAGLTPGTRYQLESYHTRSDGQGAVPIAGVTVTGAVDVMTPGPIAQTRDIMDNPAQTQFTAIGTSVTVRYVAAWNGMVQLNGFTLASVDAPPQVRFAAAAASGRETESPAYLPAIVLSPPQAQVVTVDYAVTGGTATRDIDYTLADGTLTFNPGETSKTINIGIMDDDVGEDDETIVVTLSNPIGGEVKLGSITTLTYTINDRPVVGFESDSTVAVMEDLGPIVITVKLSYSYKETVTVDYAGIGGTATAGDDYIMTPGTLTFAPGEISKTISIELVDDMVLEDAETIVIELSNPTNATLGSIQQHTANIRDPIRLKVDLALPINGGTTEPVPGTAKEGWWPYVAPRWFDMYMHDAVWERGEGGEGPPPESDGIDGTGVHVALGCGGVGDGGFHVYHMCRCNLAGGCAPTGSPAGDPIANGWYHNVDWGGERTGDILMRINGLPPGEYELKSYHNHWEPCTQSTRHCLDCYSNMPNMPLISAQSLPPGALPGYSKWNFTPGTGIGVTPIQDAYDVDVTTVTSDDEVSTSVIKFHTDGNDVLVIYDGGDNTYPDPARPGREGSKGILNAFELILVKPDKPTCQCMGDLAGTDGFSDPDNKVDTGDMAKLLSELITGGGDAGNNYKVQSPSDYLLLCGDLAGTDGFSAPDGRIDTGDMARLLSHLIVNGDPDNNYECGCVVLP